MIILQADEGPFAGLTEFPGADGEDANWRELSDEALQAHMRILNAYYFPGVDANALYPSITPVNSFRLLFNLYLGESYELLEDKSYIFPDWEHPYVFIDVTARLKWVGQSPGGRRRAGKAQHVPSGG